MDKMNFKNHPSFEMFKNSTGRMLKKYKLGTEENNICTSCVCHRIHCEIGNFQYISNRFRIRISSGMFQTNLLEMVRLDK